MNRVYSQFIDGALTKGSDSESWINFDPANNLPLGEVYQATPQDVEAAVSSSTRAFHTWKNKTGAERVRVLTKAAQLLRERVEELALIETIDVGKPIAESLAVDISSAAYALEYFGGIAASIHGEYVDLKNAFGYTRPEPLGVCVGIGAWNYPIQIAAWKAAPALACGNAMIFKPSELTPATALELAKIFMEAGAPAGLFNVLQGDGRVGAMLVDHLPHCPEQISLPFDFVHRPNTINGDARWGRSVRCIRLLGAPKGVRVNATVNNHYFVTTVISTYVVDHASIKFRDRYDKSCLAHLFS